MMKVIESDENTIREMENESERPLSRAYLVTSSYRGVFSQKMEKLSRNRDQFRVRLTETMRKIDMDEIFIGN